MPNEKDIAEKNLESYNDIFADIANVFLFDGEQVVKETELVDESTEGILKVDGKLHEEVRDVAKSWIFGNIRLLLLGYENQTARQAIISFRTAAYDGESYKSQLIKRADAYRRHKKDKTVEIPSIYPVITLVLYFGLTRWKPLSIKDYIRKNCPNISEELLEFVNDYKANVIEIAFLPDETVDKFKSDFRYVVDHFVKMRKKKYEKIPYSPS